MFQPAQMRIQSQACTVIKHLPKPDKSKEQQRSHLLILLSTFPRLKSLQNLLSSSLFLPGSLYPNLSPPRTGLFWPAECEFSPLIQGLT